jgi:hypothetical protein
VLPLATRLIVVAAEEAWVRGSVRTVPDRVDCCTFVLHGFSVLKSSSQVAVDKLVSIYERLNSAVVGLEAGERGRRGC